MRAAGESGAPKRNVPCRAAKVWRGFSIPTVAVALDRRASPARATAAGLQQRRIFARQRRPSAANASNFWVTTAAPKSRSPRAMVLRAIPVAHATAVTPPNTAGCASVGANKRRPRSSRPARRASYHCRMPFNQSCHRDKESHQTKSIQLFSPRRLNNELLEVKHEAECGQSRRNDL